MAENQPGGIVEIDSQLPVTGFGTRFIERARHSVFAGRMLSEGLTEAVQDGVQRCARDEIVDIVDVGTIQAGHAS
jgi:hypothetical protein